MALTPEEKASFDKVKNAVNTLRAEYDAICENIVATQKQLAELPLLPVPVADLKAAILDFVDASGGGYLSESVKPAIIAFATHQMSAMSVKEGELGKPLGFESLERAVTPSSGALARAQLLTYGEKYQFNDMVLYAFFGTLVKAGLSAVMDTMTDADFGYDKLHPAKIGTDRATRRATIQSTQDLLTELHARKATLADNLRQLGVTV